MVVEVLFVLPEDWAVVHDPASGDTDSFREIHEVDRFATEMTRTGQVSVRVLLPAELPDRIGDEIVLCEESLVEEVAGRLGTDRTALFPRLVLFATGRGHDVPNRVESFSGAGALMGHMYWDRFLTADDSGYEDSYGMLGRKDVATRIGAWWGGFWETERYCLMGHAEITSLPELLAAYLVDYCAAGYQHGPAPAR